MAGLARWMAAVAVLASLAMPAGATAGELLENQRLPTTSLAEPLAYTVYLPEGYGASEERYPVLYLLHGFGADEREWIVGGRIDDRLDRMIAAEEISPVIAVMPGADKSWYVDSARFRGPGDYETAIVQDLTAAIDAAYRTWPDRGHRAIAGLSMGGYGALRLAFAHPGMFGAVASLSGAIFKPDGLSWNQGPPGLTRDGAEDWYPRTFGATFDIDIYRARSPFSLVDEVAALADPPRILLAVGDDDYFELYDGTAEMFLDLRRAGLKPELRVANGGHDWPFWRSMTGEMLRFFDQAWQADRDRQAEPRPTSAR